MWQTGDRQILTRHTIQHERQYTADGKYLPMVNIRKLRFTPITIMATLTCWPKPILIGQIQTTANTKRQHWLRIVWFNGSFRCAHWYIPFSSWWALIWANGAVHFLSLHNVFDQSCCWRRGSVSAWRTRTRPVVNCCMKGFKSTWCRSAAVEIHLLKSPSESFIHRRKRVSFGRIFRNRKQETRRNSAPCGFLFPAQPPHNPSPSRRD